MDKVKGKPRQDEVLQNVTSLSLNVSARGPGAIVSLTCQTGLQTCLHLPLKSWLQITPEREFLHLLWRKTVSMMLREPDHLFLFSLFLLMQREDLTWRLQEDPVIPAGVAALFEFAACPEFQPKHVETFQAEDSGGPRSHNSYSHVSRSIYTCQ